MANYGLWLITACDYPFSIYTVFAINEQKGTCTVINGQIKILCDCVLEFQCYAPVGSILDVPLMIHGV